MSNKLTSTIYGLSNDNHRKPLTYVRTPYTGKNIYTNIMNSCLCFLTIDVFLVSSCKSPLSIQTANSVSRTQLNLSCLIPYIKKGREMRTERSVMYKTPCKNDSLDRSLIDEKLKNRSLTTIRQHLFSRDNISSHDDTCLSEERMNLTGNVYKCKNIS